MTIISSPANRRARTTVKIAANLNVLDEVDLIERCIQHLRSIGVDVIVLTDFGSIDGTAERLEAFSHDADIFLIRTTTGKEDVNTCLRMYQMTLAELDVDRVLFLDADEFWLPKSGNIKDSVALAQADAFSVRRLNVPLVAHREVLPVDLSPASYDKLYVVASPLESGEHRLKVDPELPWISTKVEPKLMINPKAVAGFHTGAHSIVVKEGTIPVIVTPDDLIVAHIPFSTCARFSRKLGNIERFLIAIGHHFTGSQAWHWRRWLEVAKAGNTEREFQRQVLTGPAFHSALADGVIQSVSALFSRQALRQTGPN